MGSGIILIRNNNRDFFNILELLEFKRSVIQGVYICFPSQTRLRLPQLHLNVLKSEIDFS
jgi:hypothetical protein